MEPGCEPIGGFGLQRASIYNPGPAGEWMFGQDLAMLKRYPQGSAVDLQEIGRLREVHPSFCHLPLSRVARDLVV